MNWFLKYKVDHVIFWTLTVFFHGYTRQGILVKADGGQFILELVVRNGLLALVIYGNLLFVFPRFIQEKKYVTGLGLVLFSLIAYTVAKSFHDGHLHGVVLGDFSRKGIESHLFYNLSIVTFYFIFATTLYLSKQWYVQRELIRKIELEKISTELEYLKAQINPHFLFNSLNTVFFQIDKQNALARETLGKFSDMLRYQLYECNGHAIPVEKEVNYLSNYLELQRLRKDENYDIRFSAGSDLRNFNLPPLLLLPFVENACKYVSHYTDRKNTIDIELSRSGNLFRMRVFNTRDIQFVHTGNGGIGLKNVKRRLELLFQDRYLLDIAETPDSFMVNLELKIDS